MRKLPNLLTLAIVLSILSCSSSKKASNADASTSNNPTLKKTSSKMFDENTFQLEGMSDDPTYAYDQKNAVKVGGGVANERRYLNALLGPNGESITYTRLGSCCQVPSKNGFMGYAVLDIYEIKYDGLEKPIKIYINMYDPGILKAPKGFTYRK